MNCIRCGHLLKNKLQNGKLIFQCEHCNCRGVTLSALRGLSSGDQFVNALWHRAKFSSNNLGGQCPCCHRTMSLIALQNPQTQQTVEIDVCTACQFIWFDAGELEAVAAPPATAPAASTPAPPPPARTPARTPPASRRSSTADPSEPIDHSPDFAWQYIPAFLGFPVEKNAPSKAKGVYPWITWLLAVLCIGLFCLSLCDYRKTINTWGYIPAQWYRYGGLTILTSMLLHGGLGHLIGNMYFLLIFGDNVEDLTGKLKYAVLLLCSGLCATLTHTIFNPSSTIPCIGASGFISGIIACYTICFPKVRLSFMYRIFFFYRFFSIPVWVATLIWFGFQIGMGILLSINTKPGTISGGGVAYMAHVGGFIPGVIFAICHRIHAKKQYEKAKRNFILASHNIQES